MLSAIYQANCLPSCHAWEEVKKGVVKDKNSEEVYGAAHPDTKDIVRTKLIVLFFLQTVVMVPRIPYRLWGIIKGNSVQIGLHKAQQEWRLETQKWRLEGQAAGKPPPSQNSFRLKVAGKVSYQLVKDIVKVATYPLAWIGMEFAALYGSLFNPYDGRAMFGAIEHAWSSDELFPIPGQGGQDIMLGEYLAKCMQPQSVWKERNLYRFADYYAPRTLRSSLRDVEFSVKNQEKFFKEEGINTKDILDCVRDYQQNITKFSPKASGEFGVNDKGQKYLKQTREQEKIRDNLQLIIKKLAEIEKLNDELFVELNQPNLVASPKTLELDKCKRVIQYALNKLNNPKFKEKVTFKPPTPAPVKVETKGEVEQEPAKA